MPSVRRSVAHEDRQPPFPGSSAERKLVHPSPKNCFASSLLSYLFIKQRAWEETPCCSDRPLLQGHPRAQSKTTVIFHPHN